MKKIYSVNNSKEVLRTLEGLKSRITSIKPALTLLLVLMVGAWSVPAWGQNYQESKWWSVYDTNEHTGDASNISGVTVCSYSAFAPNAGTFSFDSKLPGKDKSEKQWSNTDPKEYEVEDYQIKFGEKTVNVAQNVSATSERSGKGNLFSPYRWTFNYTYNYRHVEGSGMSSELTSIKADYIYKLANASISIIPLVTGVVYVKNVKVPMAKHIRLVKDGEASGATSISKSFGSVTWGTKSNAQTVSFRSFLTNGNITVKLTSGDKNVWRLGSNTNTTGEITSSKDGYTYAVGGNKFAYNGSGACTSDASVKGKASGYDFVVYFCPEAATDYSGTITISDGTSSATVTLSGKGIKRNQTIQNFSTTAETHWTSDAITAFAAYTTDNTSGEANDLPITYTTSNDQIATVASNGAVSIVKGGNNNDTQVTLRATQAGNDWYNSTYKEVTYTINKVTPVVTWPTINSDLKYNESCPIGAQVQDYWTVGSAVDNKQTSNPTVTGSFTCTEDLLPAANDEGYTVLFTPANGNWYNSDTETIYGTVEKGDQTITWNLLAGKNARDQWYEYATGEQFDASATSGMDITYSTSNSAYATVDENNKLNVVKANEIVTITASQPGNDNWNAANPVVEKQFKTCGAKPDNWSAVTAGELTYGDLLSESELTGAVKLGDIVIEGTLAWENPSTLPSATQNNTPESFSVRFTPENENAYGSVVFDVPVTVKKAKADLNWNISHGLRENTVYSNFVTSTNTDPSASLTISVSSPKLSVEGNKLTTKGVESATNCTIYVSQAATDNYEAIAQVAWPVTIRSKVNVCLPVTMNGDLMGDMTVASTDASWCNTNSQGTDHYLTSDVRYSQAVGIALGSWKDGFTGISWTKLRNLLFGDGTFEWSTKSVDLSFTGVPDRISFSTQLQLVEFLWLGDWKTAKVTADQFILYQSADGSNYTQVQTKQGATTFDEALNPTTRYIRIEYKGNFTGFIKNLQITQKKYLTASPASLTFADETHLLNTPQELTISYSSLGSCGDQDGEITVSSTNPAFYVDETEITDKVGMDQYGSHTIRVRCNDVNQSGKIIFEAYDGTTLEVPVSSAKPVLTASSPVIFKTGTEHAPSPETLYRTLDEIGYAGCFEGAEAKFDTLYIYGVSESAASSRAWEFDASKGYNVPAIAAGNLHTPCFVYAKNGSQYDYKRTYDATTTSLNIQAVGKKLGFIGYKPAGTAAFHAIQLNGAANEQTEVYLNNVEIGVNGSALVVNNTEAVEDAFAVKVYARGTNILQANAAAVQLSANKAQLTIEDSWKVGDASAVLALRPGTGKPSIDLGGAKGKVIINGTQIELHNATNMAIAHMNDTKEETDGEVKINDGTILGDAILGLPHKTLIDGGTFNAGDIKVYKTSEKVVRALNSRNEVLGRQTTTEDQLPEWYGKAHLTLDGDKVHPMLFGGEGLCVFDNSQNDHQSNNDDNWTEKPTSTSDAIITENMDITGSLTVKSLTINPGVTVSVKKNATLSIGDGDSYIENAGNLHVENGGKVLLSTGQLNVNNFYLDANLGITDEDVTTPSASGEVQNEAMLSVAGDAYFQLALDPSDRISYGWYDFTVPFAVDVIGGISIAENTSNVPLVFNQNYAVMDYTEAKRAVNGKDWNKFSGTMVPGRVYTIALDDDYEWNTVIFKKKAGAAITGDRSFTTEYSGLGANNKDNGWNGFGNGTLHHTELDVDDKALIQLYDHKHKCYQARPAKDYTIAVGLSFFMQFDKVETINLLSAEDNGDKFMAPKREVRTVNHFRLALTAEDAVNAADNMWISASEEATAEYTIGRDVLKMGTLSEATVARMWTKRDGMNLCKSEMQLVNNEANCELGLFAPQARTYTIAIEEAPEDADLYLTYNGEVIWDLTASPYVLDLAKGMTDGYGLRVEARAPQIATGVDETNADSKSVRKVLINNTIYLITPEGKMYDIVGKSAKY